MIWHMDGQSRVIKGMVTAEEMKQLGRIEHHGEMVSISWTEKSKRYAIHRSQFHPRGALEFFRRDLKSARELAGAIAEDCKGLALR